MTDFVAKYDGGPCFFLTPAAITPNSARIEGFGLSRDPFDTFISKFREVFQIEPDIVLGPVDKAQCPAVDFLAETRTGAPPAGAIQLDSTRLGARDRLSGTIDVGAIGDVSLLLVSASGAVSHLADLENDGTGVRRFNYDVGKSPGKFLLIAVATGQPLEGLTQRSVSAESFFPLVLQKAREANRTFVAAAKYFERRG
jgi:serine/threonine-protein kinase